MSRPKFEDISSGEEFNQWYWLKTELVDICKSAGIPSHGRKFDIRDRIMYALDNRGELKPEIKISKPTSKFNWAKAKLTLETTITDNVSFGPNFRGFLSQYIGPKFKCHADFMGWVKSNIGVSLREVIIAWYALEDRKKDPTFKRDIADNNMMSQYVRDFLEDNPEATFKDAIEFWKLKKQQPMKDGFVKYLPSDLDLD